MPGILACAFAHAASVDITSQFAIARTGLALNRTTNTFDQGVTLTNVAGAALPAPLIVVVNGLPSSVALANKAGNTASGAPYVNPALPTGSLGVAASVSFVLKFANPQRISFPSTLQILSGIDLPPDPPALIAAVATGGANAFLIGRVVGASNLPITLQATTSRTCVAGVLAGGVPVGNPVAATTDSAGYFGVAVAGINPGDFVAVNVVTPTVTAQSACVVSSRDNDSWPKAFPLDGSPVSVQDLIDVPGKSRWYRFSVTPGQRIDVKLSGLPADYDVAVFKDIGAAFASQFNPTTATTSDLLKLTAEYAPSVFSPSVFSPSVFSPSVFSPSVFSPSVFSPSVFSPSVFSPSVFSPSVFSPSVFSPSVFSPSVFSPSVFSPSVFSAQEIAEAFSTAQTRSVISVAATPGTADEATVVNTWNNTGNFYVRVVGRNGAFDTTTPFTLTITKGATTCANVTDTTLAPRARSSASGLFSVFVTDSSRVALDTPLAIGGTLRDRLTAITKRAEVNGVLVDVGTDARVRALKMQAANNPACPFAKNLVASEIKGIVDSYRANPLRYIVLVGNDDAIPFFRFPDESGLGQETGYVPPVESNSPSEASLRLDYVLSQDAYGSSTNISLRTNDYPVPGLAVGRLVETPDEIGGVLDAYVTAQGVVTPRSSLVTGYDFLADAASAVQGELQSGTGATPDALITPNGKSPQDPASWTATDLAQKLFGARHDVIFLAGHFSAQSALAADFATNILTTDLVASQVDFTNSIVFSAGCHSGYNLVDVDAIAGVTQPLDWAQAFARKGATLVAGTGYQYGDTDFLEYSERIYDNFSRQLRAGTGAIAIGEALVKAKLDYLAITPDIRGIHEKALLEATLFGLPMLGVNMPAGRGAASGTAPVVTPTGFAAGPAVSLGLKSFDLALAPSLASQSITLKNSTGGADVVATWFSGPDGVVTKPGEPALPLVAVNVTPTDSKIVLRGIGFRGGSYTDVAPMFPFSGAPTTELRGVHVPFLSPTFYPAVMWTPNYFGALAGNGGTQLLVTPVQHRVASVADGTSTQRRFGGLNLRLFYSGNLSQAALSEAPSIVAVDAAPAGAGIAFAAQVIGDPAAGIQQVWVTYTSDGATTWTSLDLTQCVAPLPAACGTTEDSRVWKGQLASSPPNLKYVVQAVNGVGLVALADNGGAYFGVSGAPASPTVFALSSPPSNATFGDSIRISGTLTSGGAPVAGRIVTINVGGSTQIGVTGSDGVVTFNIPPVGATGSFQVTAAFAGDQGFQSTSTSAPLTVAKATSALAPLAPVGATLTGTVSGNAQPLQQESVAFAVDGPGGARTIFAITDYLGRATLPPPGLPAGTYTVTQASYGGNATYAASSVLLAQQFTVAKTPQSITFLPLIAKTEGDPDFAVFATASSTLPVSFAASGACTIAGNSVHLTAAGTCTITASQAGDANYDPATPVAQSFTVATNGKNDQVITFGPAPTNVHLGDPPLTVTATSTSPTAPPSGIPILFSSLTPATCTTGGANGATVTLVAAGNCVIAANEAGNATYNPAPQTTLAFSIAPVVTVTPQFTVTGSMQTARSDHTATLLEDGRVLVAGGFGPTGALLNSAELYCPDNATAPPDFVVCPAGQRGTFTATAGLPAAVAGQTATRLHDGTVVLIGGGNAVLQWFTPSTRTWNASAPTTLADRAFHTATLLANGKVFVAGGVNSSGITLASTFTLDTATTPWTIAQGPDLNFARESHSATALPDGTVLIAGGRRAQSGSFVVIGEYERYDPSAAAGAGAIADVSAMAIGRFWHAAESAGTNVVVAGGSCDGSASVSSALRNVELFSLTTGAGAPLTCNAAAGPADLQQARRAFTLTRLVDGTLVAIGGEDQTTLERPSSEFLPSGSGTWAFGPSLTDARSVHQSTLLLDGRVLVTGGTGAGGVPLASAELLSGAGGSGTGTANQPPIANAGPDQTVAGGATVQLTSAGSSDPEGRPLSYFWSFVSKPAGSAAQLSNPNAANPTFVAAVRGLYIVQLIVNDGGNPPLDSMPASVRITAGNRAPVAVNDSYSTTQDTALNVTAANGVLANDTDADGDSLTAAKISNPTHGVVTLNADGSFNYVPAGGYSGPDSFTYRANDGTADSNTATVSITVTPTATNHPPVANAGTNQSVTVGAVVQMSGACTDADNDPTTPTWSFTSKPGGSETSLSSTSILNPTFTADVAGSYGLQLVCNDTHVDSAPSSVTITATTVTGTITLGGPITVQPGGSVPLGIAISPAAPAGGLVITLTSNDPTIATFATPTITIAAGQTSGSATVFGVNVGSTTLGAQAPGYGSTTTSATTTGAPFAFTVTNLNDSGTGSLRDSVAQANAAPGSNIILFQPGLTGTITLTSGQIRISDTLTIVGPGADVITIDGSANDRIFTINEQNAPACPALTAPADYLVTITGLKVQNAHRNTDNGGGAINTSHSLLLDSMAFVGNAAKVGGAVHMNMQYPGQVLSIGNSQFTNNLAKPLSATVTGIADIGGAVAVTENCSDARTQPVSVNIANSTFSGNRVQPASLYGVGGAIGVAAYADVTIADTRIVDNHVDAPNPAVANQVYFGAGVFAQTKSLTVLRSEIAENTNIDTAASGQTRGGGLALDNDIADLQTPALAMAVTIVDSTISGNADPVIGGALWASGNVALELDNSTVTNNSAPNGTTGGIQLTTSDTNPPGANQATPPTLKLVSSILANNATGTNDLGTNSTKIPSFTLNANNSLIRSICATCNISVNGAANKIGVDPLLDVLAFNGATTRTHALLVGSPAIDAGSNPLALTTDQRGDGFPRVVGAAADIGAYEFGGNHPPVANAGPDQTVNVGQLVQLNGSCTDVDGDPLTPTWSITSAPTGSTAVLSSTSILNPTFTPNVAGNYVLRLVCNDTHVDSTPSTVTINTTGATIALNLVNTQLVGLGQTAQVRVVLSPSAPTGGKTVTLTSDNAAVLGVAAPGTVTIVQGGNEGFGTLSGASVGSTTLHAAANGYATASLPVTVTANLITVGGPTNVTLNSTAQVSITLAQPAGAGGLQVAVTSSDPTIISVDTPTVTIPANQTTASATLRGKFPGNVTIVAQAAGYASGTSPATVGVTLDITEATVSMYQFDNRSITIALTSGGTPAVAPPGGLPLTLSSSNPACVVSPPVTVPAGTESTTVTLTYGGTATLPCTSTVTANGPPGTTPDTVAVTVNPAPGLRFYYAYDEANGYTGAIRVGAGLEACLGVNLRVEAYNLSTGTVANVTTATAVTITSSNSGIAVVSPSDSTTAGTSSVVVTIPANTYNTAFCLAGVAGHAGQTANLTATATGLIPASARTVNVVQPVVGISGISTGLTALSPDEAFNVFVGIGQSATPGTLYLTQNAPKGSGGLNVTVSVPDTSVAQLKFGAQAGASVTATIPANSYYNSATALYFDPLAAGTTTVSAAATGFAQSGGTTYTNPKSVTVAGTALRIYYAYDEANGYTGAIRVGAGLEACLGVNLRVEAYNVSTGTAANVTSATPVTITSSNGGVALVSPSDSTTAGTSSVVVTIPANNYNAAFCLAGVSGQAGQTANLTATATGLIPASARTVNVVQPVVGVSSISTNLTTLSPDDAFNIYVGIGQSATPGTLYLTLNAPKGGGGLNVTVSVPDTNVAQLKFGAQVGASVTATIPANSYYNSATALYFDPLAAGTTTVSATATGFAQSGGTSYTNPRSVTVAGTALRFYYAYDEANGYTGAIRVGAGLEACIGGNLRVEAYNVSTGSVANVTSATPVTITSSNGGVALVSPSDSTTAGTSSVVVTIAANNYNTAFCLAGVAGQAGQSANLTATATGLIAATPRTVSVVQPVIGIIGISTGLTTLSPDEAFNVYVGIAQSSTPGTLYLTLNAPKGSGGLNVTVSSSDASVAQLKFGAQVGTSVIATIPANSYYNSATTLYFDPLAAGTTSISATATGFVQSGGTSYTNPRSVSVAGAALRFYYAYDEADGYTGAIRVGAGLEACLGGNLRVEAYNVNTGSVASVTSAAAVTITSSNGGVAAVSPSDSTTTGTASVVVTIPANSYNVAFCLAGIAGQTGQTANLTATSSVSGLAASAPRQVSLLQPLIGIIGITTNLTTASPDDAFNIYVGIGQSTSPNTLYLTLSAPKGGGGLGVSVSLPDTSVAQLKFGAQVGQSVIATIPANSYYNSATALFFDPLAAGTTTVSATAPGFAQSGGTSYTNPRSVSVSP